MNQTRLLIIEDDATLKTALFRALTRNGYSVTTAATQKEALTWTQCQTPWDAILLDLQLPDGTGLGLLEYLKQKMPAVPVIILTGFGSVEQAVAATQKGASRFLVKPVSLDDIITSLKSVLQNIPNPASTTTVDCGVSKPNPPHPDQVRTLGSHAPVHAPSTHSAPSFQSSRPALGAHPNLVGESQEIQHILDLVHRVADSDATILIQGESGTGKEVIARSIHQLSPRKNGPFVAINCGAIPPELLESELFGHVKGAFTGAINHRVGRFELADGGILFLDEIGDMSPALQVKILRALQERSFEPVGSTRSVSVNVQVIAATHVNLDLAVQEGRFREDLYYRLNVIPIQVPALRERKSDIPLLIQYFSKRFSARRREGLNGFSSEAIQSLLNYPWPGNIRELENLIERLTIIKGRGQVELRDLPLKYQSKAAFAPALPTVPMDSELPAEGIDFNAAVDQYENNLIMKALEKTGWNRNQAAHLLKINRTTLVEKIKKKGLKPPEELGCSESLLIPAVVPASADHPSASPSRPPELGL